MEYEVLIETGDLTAAATATATAISKDKLDF